MDNYVSISIQFLIFIIIICIFIYLFLEYDSKKEKEIKIFKLIISELKISGKKKDYFGICQIIDKLCLEDIINSKEKEHFQNVVLTHFENVPPKLSLKQRYEIENSGFLLPLTKKGNKQRIKTIKKIIKSFKT